MRIGRFGIRECGLSMSVLEFEVQVIKKDLIELSLQADQKNKSLEEHLGISLDDFYDNLVELQEEELLHAVIPLILAAQKYF